jgi:putative ABC transport system permease protein
VAFAVVIAAHQRLGITRDLVVAAARAAAQLAAVGVVLLVLFRYAGVLGALVWVAVMVVIAGQVAGRRGRGVPGAARVATLAIAVGTVVALGVLLGLRIVPPRPAMMVPIGGMIVANTMQAVGLTLLRLTEEVHQSRPAIETRLSLALPVDEAFAPTRRSAARAALLPAIDATKVVGLVSLPGAMTGLILAGIDPLVAVRYQIVVMYMLLGAATAGAALAGRLAQRSLFDTTAHRLRVTTR